MTVSSNAGEVAAKLRAFNVTAALVEWLDGTAPEVIGALRKEAPYGEKDRGPHLRDRIFVTRQSSIGHLHAEYQTDRSPVAKWVLGGTQPHDIPNAFGFGENFGIGGRFDGKFHPGTKPNPFNVRAWLGVEGSVTEALVERLEARLV